MFNARNRDKQVELFGDFHPARKSRKGKFRLSRISLSLSYENIIILSIGLIMLLVACYSLGVEKGKDLVQVKDRLSTESLEIREESKPNLPSESGTQPKEPKQKKVKTEVVSAKEGLSSYPYIQVATFRTDKYADKEKQRLKTFGYQPFVLTKGRFREVCAGGYKNKDEAIQAFKRLRKIYADCIMHNK